MADQIRVLIVDDIPETRDHLTKLLGFESDVEVVGAAASGTQALQLAAELPAGSDHDVIHETADLFFHVFVGLVGEPPPPEPPAGREGR